MTQRDQSVGTTDGRRRAVWPCSYNAHRFGMAYADPGPSYYEERYRQRVLVNLRGPRRTSMSPMAQSQGGTRGSACSLLALTRP